MATQTKFPTNAEGSNWTTPTNVLADDGARATYNSTGQNDLIVRTFDFTIPSNATILGITVNTQGQGASATAAQRQVRIGLTKDGLTLAGTRKTAIQYAQNVDTDVASGGGADLWGTTWTPAEINHQDFGILLSDNDVTANAISIDVVSITVTYSLPAYPTDPAPSYVYDQDVEFKTTISSLEGKMEQRHALWGTPRYKFKLVYDNQENTAVDTIWNFYIARKGRFEAFTFVDPRTSVSYICRFDADNLTRSWFEANLARTGITICESNN